MSAVLPKINNQKDYFQYDNSCFRLGFRGGWGRVGLEWTYDLHLGTDAPELENKALKLMTIYFIFLKCRQYKVNEACYEKIDQQVVFLNISCYKKMRTTGYPGFDFIIFSKL